MPDLAKEFQENGAVLLPKLLGPELLAHCRRVYDEALHNPVRKSPMQVKYPDGSHYNPAVGYRTAMSHVFELLAAGPFAKVLADLWGSESVWFFDHEIWWKKHGATDNARNPTRSDTPFHQDSRSVLAACVVPLPGINWPEGPLSKVELLPRRNAPARYELALTPPRSRQ